MIVTSNILILLKDIGLKGVYHALCLLSPSLLFSLSLLSHLFPGGTANDQLNVSPQGGGAGGSAVVAGDSSTLAPGSELLNVSKRHKRSRSEGAIHNVITERYVYIHVYMYSACGMIFCMYTFCIYYRSELESPSAGDRALNKGKRSSNKINIFNIRYLQYKQQ